MENKKEKNIISWAINCFGDKLKIHEGKWCFFAKQPDYDFSLIPDTILSNLTKSGRSNASAMATLRAISLLAAVPQKKYPRPCPCRNI